jgi:hypothetical protein
LLFQSCLLLIHFALSLQGYCYKEKIRSRRTGPSYRNCRAGNILARWNHFHGIKNRVVKSLGRAKVQA